MKMSKVTVTAWQRPMSQWESWQHQLVCVCCDNDVGRGKAIVYSEGGWWKDFVRWRADMKGTSYQKMVKTDNWINVCVMCVCPRVADTHKCKNHNNEFNTCGWSIWDVFCFYGIWRAKDNIDWQTAFSLALKWAGLQVL